MRKSSQILPREKTPKPPNPSTRYGDEPGKFTHSFPRRAFKKNVNAGTLKPCGTCHPVSNRPGDRGRLELKTAYHQACFKCHKEEVAGQPKGGPGMCPVPKGGESREKKK